MKKQSITNIIFKYTKYDFNENVRYSNEMFVFLIEIFLFPSTNESFVIMTVTFDISIKILDSAKYIIGILAKILEISPDNFRTVTFFLLSTEKSVFRHKS